MIGFDVLNFNTVAFSLQINYFQFKNKLDVNNPQFNLNLTLDTFQGPTFQGPTFHRFLSNHFEQFCLIFILQSRPRDRCCSGDSSGRLQVPGNSICYCDICIDRWVFKNLIYALYDQQNNLFLRSFLIQAL
jgi:hypothetical protein